MPFGSERKVLFKNSAQYFLWAVRGDSHLGRWARYFRLKNMLSRLHFKPARILDAGCGLGQTAFYLRRKFPQAEIDGMDISRQDIASCRQINQELGSGIEFLEEDLQKVQFQKQYDFICLTNALCSIPDYKEALARLSGKLSSGGFLLIQDMNLDYIRRHFGEKIVPTDVVRTGFLVEDLKKCLEASGFKVLHTEKNMGPLGLAANRAFDVVRGNPLFLNLVFPVLIFLSYIDARVKVNDGPGLLILAQARSGE